MRTFLVVFLLANVTLSARAQRYVTNLSGATQTTFGGYGTGALPFTKADFLGGMAKAQIPAVDPATLELIFDAGTKELLVVDRTTGATVSLVYTLTNDQEFDFGPGDALGSPAEVIRRADLLEPGSTVAVGSIAGLLKRTPTNPFLSASTQSYYRWVADFQVLSSTGGVFVGYEPSYNTGRHAPMLLRGQFKVRNVPFVASATSE